MHEMVAAWDLVSAWEAAVQATRELGGPQRLPAEWLRDTKGGLLSQIAHMPIKRTQKVISAGVTE